jgi:hypothetical protein
LSFWHLRQEFVACNGSFDLTPSVVGLFCSGATGTQIVRSADPRTQLVTAKTWADMHWSDIAAEAKQLTWKREVLVHKRWDRAANLISELVKPG